MQAALFRMRPVRYPSCRQAYRMKSLQVQRGYICLPNLCLHYVELNNKDNKQDRRTMAIIRHMRRSAFSAGRPGGLIREIIWKAGKSEVICLHGGLGLCRLISDEWRKTLDLFLDFYRKEKDFVPFQIGFRSLAADCAKILPI